MSSRRAVPVPIKPRSDQSLQNMLGLGAKFNGISGYLQIAEHIGAGHPGVAIFDRIVMSLKSGIDSEVEYSLNTLTYLSCHEPGLIRFEYNEFLGHQLLKYFLKPYVLILEGDESEVDGHMITLSLEALFTLRNSIQDLENQQWLSQVKNIKKHIVEVLKLFVGWFYTNSIKQSYHLASFHDLWKESFLYLLDLIDPLSCYFVDNNKQDPLFNQLLQISTHIKDKYIFITTLKSLSHLLIITDKSKITPDNATTPSATTSDTATTVNDSPTPEVKQAPHNCIEAIKEEHLEIYVSTLFVNDDELSFAVLSFLKLYLSSEALHPSHSDSIKQSQLSRLKKLVQITSSRLNLHVLMKQLPALLVSNLHLIDQSQIPGITPTNLLKRSNYRGVPTERPNLPEQLYKIIVRFPEPLRATTWLRCCYEPYVTPDSTTSDSNTNIKESSEVAPGEVTQISLWKAYEAQFEDVWKLTRGDPNNNNSNNNNNNNNNGESDWVSLLPAVDFIKNVTSAFPESETMVVTIPTSDPTKPPKKKFVIKGIQPRQFPVSIDIGNYEALKKRKVQQLAANIAGVESVNPDLPLGHIDEAKFEQQISSANDAILSATSGFPRIDTQTINLLSHDLLDYIITELLEPDTDGEYKNIFRYYNIDWLPDVIYTNPGLIESGYINSKWLLYLV